MMKSYQSEQRKLSYHFLKIHQMKAKNNETSVVDIFRMSRIITTTTTTTNECNNNITSVVRIFRMCNVITITASFLLTN